MAIAAKVELVGGTTTPRVVVGADEVPWSAITTRGVAIAAKGQLVGGTTTRGVVVVAN
ncbi:hypothetical protein [Paenibacillus sp. PL2-23]|uniref:hypothetical protein n=1 Tax=Paenibacillus sp. PL2-23 TaxID=2100729 RepID=UPI0030F97710